MGVGPYGHVGRNGHKPSIWRQRKRWAIQIISQGGGPEEIAKKWQVSRTSVHVEMKKRWPALYDEMKKRRWANHLAPKEICRRLQIVQLAPSKRQAARDIGISDARLHNFLARHAPDGVEAALEDYSEPEELEEAA